MQEYKWFHTKLKLILSLTLCWYVDTLIRRYVDISQGIQFIPCSDPSGVKIKSYFFFSSFDTMQSITFSSAHKTRVSSCYFLFISVHPVTNPIFSKITDKVVSLTDEPADNSLLIDRFGKGFIDVSHLTSQIKHPW